MDISDYKANFGLILMRQKWLGFKPYWIIDGSLSQNIRLPGQDLENYRREKSFAERSGHRQPSTLVQDQIRS